MCALGGNDLVTGGRGNDWIDGSEGHHRLGGDVAGAGDVGAPRGGDDFIVGGPGNDGIVGELPRGERPRRRG